MVVYYLGIHSYIVGETNLNTQVLNVFAIKPVMLLFRQL